MKLAIRTIALEVADTEIIADVITVDDLTKVRNIQVIADKTFNLVDGANAFPVPANVILDLQISTIPTRIAVTGTSADTVVSFLITYD